MILWMMTRQVIHLIHLMTALKNRLLHLTSTSVVTKEGEKVAKSQGHY